jgi:hypothetical protein
MELNRRIASFHVFETIRRRLSAIQMASSKTTNHSEKIKMIRGLVLIFLALIFAWISLEATAASGVARYRSETWPKESLLDTVLKERGFVRRASLGEYSRQLQNHPDAFSSQSMVWVTPDSCLIYLSTPGFADSSSQLWTCEVDPKPPVSWHKLGSGIEGFENLQEFLEKRPKISLSGHKVRLNIVDPKEIRY